MDKATTFRDLVEMVFNNWTALQLAVEHGMGGANSKQLAGQFVDQITNSFISQSKAMDNYDVEDLLIDILDDKFDTECEDGSTLEVASELCRLYDICIKGDLTEIQVEIEKLQRPSNKLWLCKPIPDQTQEVTAEVKAETPPPQLMDVEDDGWTVVQRK